VWTETESFNQIVPYESAVLGLTGDRETTLRRRADRSDVCCFNPDDEVDEKDFEFVEGNLKRMYWMVLSAGEIS
jgi:hypothetical protein